MWRFVVKAGIVYKSKGDESQSYCGWDSSGTTGREGEECVTRDEEEGSI